MNWLCTLTYSYDVNMFYDMFMCNTFFVCTLCSLWLYVLYNVFYALDDLTLFMISFIKECMSLLFGL